MSVSEAPVSLDEISTFSIYTGIQALYWPSATKNKPIPPYTDSVPPSTNHCCSILTQCTPSSPRNAQSSQLDLVIIVVTVNNSHTPQLLQLSKESDHCSERSRRKNPPLCQMIFSPILGWLSNKIGKIRPVRAFRFLEIVLQNIWQILTVRY